MHSALEVLVQIDKNKLLRNNLIWIVDIWLYQAYYCALKQNPIRDFKMSSLERRQWWPFPKKISGF